MGCNEVLSKSALKLQRKRANYSPKKIEEQKQSAKHCMKKKRSIDAMDPVKSKAQNKKNQDRMKKKRSIDATDPELRDRQKTVDKNWQADRSDKNPKRVKTGSFEMSMEKAINKSVKQAKKYLHRTKHEDDGSEHKANVCIVCD